MTEQRGDAMVDPKTLTRAGLATEVKAYERPLLTLERPAGRRKHSELLNGYTGTNDAALKVCFIIREYPPNVYGGAGAFTPINGIKHLGVDVVRGAKPRATAP